MRGRINEIAEGNQGGRETNCRAIESRDEDFRMCVKGVSNVKVIGDEGAEPMTPEVGAFGYRTRDRDVCAAVY